MSNDDFNVNLKEYHNFIIALSQYPNEVLGKVNRIVRDQAFSFKKNAVNILFSKFTIRDKKFVEKAAWKMELPNEDDPLEKQIASVSSKRIEGGDGGYFDGWESNLYGSPMALRKKPSSKYYRPIWENAREGLSHEGIAKKEYRLRSADRMPDASEFSMLYGMPMNQILRMFEKSDASGRSKQAKKMKDKSYALGKNKVFKITDPNSPGGGWRPGIYAFIDDKVRMIQGFETTPRMAEKFDWRGDAEKKVLTKYTPVYIYEKYINPVVKKVFKK